MTVRSVLQIVPADEALRVSRLNLNVNHPRIAKKAFSPFAEACRRFSTLLLISRLGFTYTSEVNVGFRPDDGALESSRLGYVTAYTETCAGSPNGARGKVGRNGAWGMKNTLP